jgi:aryl carrier-like protein
MTFEERVQALSADQQALLADRLRRLGAILDTHEPAGGKRLVAYVVPCSDHEVDPADLRGFLRARLPEPMVPSAFVVLDEFPVTPSGKLDRRALSVPETHGTPAAAVPTTSQQVALADLWAEILGLDRVGVNDDFFALGGDSIRLLRLCARARELGIALTPRDLFEHPTIAGLAARR